MNFLNDLFKKITPLFESTRHCAFFIDSQNNYQFVEVHKIKESYTPSLWRRGVLPMTLKDGVFDKKVFVDRFKNIQSKSYAQTIYINELTNPKLQKEIVSSLKIAGFKKVEVKKENIKSIILLSKTKDTENTPSATVWFEGSNITVYITNGTEILQKKVISTSNFSVSKVSNIFKNTGILNKIFLFNVTPEMLGPVRGVFHVAEFDTEIVNIWQNILNFSDTIPGILARDAHLFVESLSMAVPGLADWKEDAEETEGSIMPTPTLYLPKKKKLFLPKNKKKVSKKKEGVVREQEIKPKDVGTPEKTETPKQTEKKSSLPFWKKWFASNSNPKKDKKKLVLKDKKEGLGKLKDLKSLQQEDTPHTQPAKKKKPTNKKKKNKKAQ